MNKQETQELTRELTGIAERIFNHYNNGATLEIIIHKTSKSNLTWYYSARLWYLDEQGEISAMNLNWFLAMTSDTNLTNDHYVKGYGVGTERSFQVAYNLGLTLGTFGFSNNSTNNGYLISRYVLTA
jgi:hypothetical protein